jgi:hypothetical protein
VSLPMLKMVACLLEAMVSLDREAKHENFEITRNAKCLPIH